MVMAQSAKDMIANSSAVGPVSSPPLAFGRSSAILWVLELSAEVRTFSIHLAVAFMFGSFLHLIIHVWVIERHVLFIKCLSIMMKSLAFLFLGRLFVTVLLGNLVHDRVKFYLVGFQGQLFGRDP